MRKANIVRNTTETQIDLTLEILSQNEAGSFEGTTNIGFMDHMMSALCVHGHLKISLKMSGDLEVDDHHSIEDLGIVFGQAFAKAVGAKSSINRFGCSYVPMDDSLSRCVIDISGRPYLVYNALYDYQMIGELESAIIREFFYAFAMNAGVTLHIENLYGLNDHHKAESIFKAFARALSDASCLRDGNILSTKGTLV